MFQLKKIIMIFISLQVIVISTFIPVFISIPLTDQFVGAFDFPITLQIPSIVLITIMFKREVVLIAFSLYLLIGLFFLPVFHNGGSLGYLLTPNFGYLLGTYPLINIIDKLNKLNHKINSFDVLKYGSLGIFSLHLVGILYGFIQVLLFKQQDILLYNISKYSLGKFGYHLLMLIPLTILIKLINYNNKK